MQITEFSVEGFGETVQFDITCKDIYGRIDVYEVTLDADIAARLGAKLLAYGTQRPTILTDDAIAALMDSPGNLQ
jgi:hypothetical protein